MSSTIAISKPVNDLSEAGISLIAAITRFMRAHPELAEEIDDAVSCEMLEFRCVMDKHGVTLETQAEMKRAIDAAHTVDNDPDLG